MRTLILLFLLGLASYAYCNKKEIEKKQIPQIQDPMIREMFEMRQKLFDDIHKSFFNDDFHSAMDFDSFFEDHESYLKGLNGEQNSLFKSSWEETQEGRILKITPTNKQSQLDIDIKDGMISIKGKNESSKEKNQVISKISSSFSIPVDVDAKKADIQDKNGEIWIKFPWVVGKIENKSKINHEKKDEDEDERPLKPSPGDITI
jgi:HSP20 family molecular chaperone IbpA